MDLIKYLEHAAVEADAVWRSGVTHRQSGFNEGGTEALFTDNARLAQLLEVRPTMICMIVAPDGGDTEEAEESPGREAPAEDADEEAGRDPED